MIMKQRVSQSRVRSARSGFTLLELILAMTMVALLTLSLYAAMNTAYKAKAAGERSILPLRATAIAADMMARDLESVVMPDKDTIIMANDPTQLLNIVCGSFLGTKESNGAGDADTIEFYAIGSDGLPDDVPLSEGVRKITIGLNPSGPDDKPALVRRVQRNVLSIEELQPEEEVICRDVRSFTVTYFDGTNWIDTWDSTVMCSDMNSTIPAIPMLVQIELVINLKGYQQPGQDPDTYRITRTIPLPIAKPVYVQ